VRGNDKIINFSTELPRSRKLTAIIVLNSICHKSEATMKFLKALFELLRETFHEWNQDKAPRLAAALAYYTAFSIAPLLVIAIAVAGLVFGEEAVRGELQGQIQRVVGAEAAGAVEEMVAAASNREAGVIASIIALVTLLLGAAGLFGQLKDALNTVWNVVPKPGTGGIIATIRGQFLSFTMVLGIGFLLLVSMVISAVLAGLQNAIGTLVPASVSVLPLINFIVSFLVTTVLFALIYKILPDAEIRWRDVWIGAAVTSLLFSLGRFLIGLYLGNSSIASSYGAAGSFVVLLVWIYYSTQILIFGAEFTQVYARRLGSQLQPSENAILLTEDQRIAQGIPHKETIERKAGEQGKLPTSAVIPNPVNPARYPLPPRDEERRSPDLTGMVVGVLVAAFTFILGLVISNERRT
jgi:membrane protein